MSTQKNLISTFKAALPTFKVYAGTIPENANVPAIAIYNVAYNRDRVVSGEQTKKWSAWRLTLVDTPQHLQTAIDEIELIDNTSNEYFQRLFVELTLEEPKALTEPYQRAFFDIRVYEK